MKLSIIITAKDENDPKLNALLRSIEDQVFKKPYEVLVVTEGTSESAKAIGLKRAKGEYVCIMASDNYLKDPFFLAKHVRVLDDNPHYVGAYPARYHHDWFDDPLNRYFALMGGNDPIPWYLGKNDKVSYAEDNMAPYGFSPGSSRSVTFWDQVATIGDNGFFCRREILLKANLEHYYHIDACQDIADLGYKTYAEVDTDIWHRTGGRFFPFFKKRLRYADQHATPQRRWHMVEVGDVPRLLFFVVSTLTLVYPLWWSLRGYRKVQDPAWFLHLPVCLMTIGVYGIWVIRRSALSFARLVGLKS